MSAKLAVDSSLTKLENAWTAAVLRTTRSASASARFLRSATNLARNSKIVDPRIIASN